MTIYTPQLGDKKEESDVPDPEVYTGSVADLKEKEVETHFLVNVPLRVPTRRPRTQVAVAVRRQPRRPANLCVLLTALLVLATGTIGGIYLYKHFAHKPFRGWCQVQYFEFQDDIDAAYGELTQNYNIKNQAYEHRKVFGSFKEEVEIDLAEGRYEKFKMPSFGDFRKATVLHDFEKNLTCIVKRPGGWKPGKCFILPLNRTLVIPPNDFWDLISKLRTGYYIPNSHIVRQQYEIVTPALKDVRPLGYYIWNECQFYKTYMLRKKDEPYALARRKRSANKRGMSYFLASNKFGVGINGADGI